MDDTAPPQPWAAQLRDFSRHNAGRHTRLDIDDDQLGAPWSEMDLSLHGVGVNPRDGCIEITLFDGEPRAAHLTHSIRNVVSVLVLAGEDGRDRELRIVYPGGISHLMLLDG
jgi:hypothetical protein